MKKIAAGLTALGSLFSALPVFAATPLRDSLSKGFNYVSETGLGTKDLRDIVMTIINIILGFLSMIAVIIILTGGFKWMTAGGNEEKVDEAKKLIIAGIIGLAVIFTSYAISRFVMLTLVNVTGGT